MPRFARWFVLACAIAALASSIAFRHGGVERPWVEIARYVPYPVYGLPATLAVVLSWRLGRVWQVVALAALGLVGSQLMALALGRAEPGSGRFRLMTYNVKSYLAVRQPGGFARLAWEIARHDPDVLVLQDAQRLTPPHPLPEPIRAALASREIHRMGEYLVASRHPLRECAPINVSYPYREDTYLRCTIGVRGRPVTLIAAHFVSPRDGAFGTAPRALTNLAAWEDNLADRMAQAQAVAKAVREVQGRVIVAGDLNAVEDSPVVRTLLDAGLRDAFSSAATGYGYTYGHALFGFSFLRIDHILIGGGISVRGCEVGAADASEHRPVIAELLVDSG